MAKLGETHNKKKEISRLYDETSDRYDSRYRDIQLEKISAVLRTLSDVRKFDLCLDAGCGTGLSTMELAKICRKLVGVDISHRSLLKAREKVRGFFVRADVENLPFKDSIFDLVVSVTVMQNVPNPSRFLEELRRVAKIDAPIIVTTLTKTISRERLSELIEKHLGKLEIFEIVGEDFLIKTKRASE